jgi:tryptophan-rich sensory protein
MERTESAADRFWRWLLPVAVLACLYVNYLYNANPPAGALSNGAMSARHPTLLTPAGYAFSIWGAIFLGLVIYTVWQWLPAQHGARLPLAINSLLARAVLMTTAWTLVFSYEIIGSSLTVMVLLLLLLAQAYGRARKLVLMQAAPGWPVWFLSFYLGWIVLATVLNFIFGLRDGFGLHWSAEASLVSCYVLLLIAVVLGLGLAWRSHDVRLPLPIAWGLVGTWMAQRVSQPGLAMAALGAASVLLLGSAVVGWRRSQQVLAAG